MEEMNEKELSRLLKQLLTESKATTSSTTGNDQSYEKNQLGIQYFNEANRLATVFKEQGGANDLYDRIISLYQQASGLVYGPVASRVYKAKHELMIFYRLQLAELAANKNDLFEAVYIVSTGLKRFPNNEQLNKAYETYQMQLNAKKMLDSCLYCLDNFELSLAIRIFQSEKMKNLPDQKSKIFLNALTKMKKMLSVSMRAYTTFIQDVIYL